MRLRTTMPSSVLLHPRFPAGRGDVFYAIMSGSQTREVVMRILVTIAVAAFLLMPASQARSAEAAATQLKSAAVPITDFSSIRKKKRHAAMKPPRKVEYLRAAGSP